ncbi:Low conductance mechanosensitive channel YnaI [Stieleria maiorica]|uniref:Low conductance mechanosensitive channel YnaI n=1 Tax=Stieleria maiorica TaxID=2795974 RepID=A0A5B9MP82_9BACT|nr:mechanosensitive ion channel family protein [Stieleria maiorica]QEG02150.1 Low conductance mechanosensitive channel YnaI [Stieleria maiorica]
MARLIVGVVATLFAFGSATAWPQAASVEESHPLRATDTSSPRATLKTFLSSVHEVYQGFSQEGRSFESEAERSALGARILRCLDLSEVAESVHDGVGRETAACLKEVLDRIELGPEDTWPDTKQVDEGGLSKWAISDTEIIIQRVKEGPREGEFLFSPETVDRAADFYVLVKDLPYKERQSITPGLYQLYLSEPGWLLPRSLVQGLPAWAHVRLLGQAVWQWAGLVLTTGVSLVLMSVIYYFGRWRTSHLRPNWLRYLVMLVCPLTAMLIPLAALYFLEQHIRISGTALLVVSYLSWLIFLLTLMVVLLGAGNYLAALIIATPWVQPHGLDSQWVRLVCRVGSILAAIIVFLEGGQQFGIPLTTLVASAGVCGLAVALAAQDTLKNVFGSIMVTLDKPFQVGDRIVAKGYDGIVEEIGLRSTKLRLLTGHQVSIPNDDMSRCDIENISRRPHIRGVAKIQLPSDTPTAKVKRAVQIVRDALHDHEGMEETYPPRVFLRDVNESSTGIVLFYWYHPANYWAYLAFTEGLNLQVMEQFEAERIPFASPALTVHLPDSEESGIDMRSER